MNITHTAQTKVAYIERLKDGGELLAFG